MVSLVFELFVAESSENRNSHVVLLKYFEASRAEQWKLLKLWWDVRNGCVLGRGGREQRILGYGKSLFRLVVVGVVLKICDGMCTVDDCIHEVELLIHFFMAYQLGCWCDGPVILSWHGRMFNIYQHGDLEPSRDCKANLMCHQINETGKN